MALNTVANGTAQVVETIFENRFMHVQELNRLGANITTDGNTALGDRASKTCRARRSWRPDLRASASLVIAGVARGRRDADRPHLSPRSRLRPDGNQAQRRSARRCGRIAGSRA